MKKDLSVPQLGIMENNMNDDRALTEFKIWVTQHYGYQNAEYLYCPTFELTYELWKKIKETPDNPWVPVKERLPDILPRRQIAMTNDTGTWMELSDSGWFVSHVEAARKMGMSEMHLYWRELALPK